MLNACLIPYNKKKPMIKQANNRCLERLVNISQTAHTVVYPSVDPCLWQSSKTNIFLGNR